MPFSVNSLFKTLVITACVGTSWLATSISTPLVRADDFSTVPAGDALYGQLKQIQSASWTPGRGAARTPNTLTRYEMALEAARAYLALNARYKADANWRAQPASSVRALREMVLALRPELQRLDVDVESALALCTTLLSDQKTPERTNLLASGGNASNAAAADALARPNTTSGLTNRNSDNRNSDNRNSDNGSSASALAVGRETRLTGGEIMMPLSQRLRISAAQSSLERTASDPFSYRGMANVSSDVVSETVGTGATLDITDWLRLRAGMEESSATPEALGIRSQLGNTRAPSLIGGAQSQSIGGGLDIEVRPGLRLSGDVERVALRDFGATQSLAGTRFGGGVDLSAWQNRLALSVNLSRLVPEDSDRLASSTAALNVAVGGERLKLKLLYKQLFGDAANATNNRVFAGGININF